tara:strand:- start:221 stop:355 length:135 start_codon:yes stop_codon:yes gene_type:complete
VALVEVASVVVLVVLETGWLTRAAAAAALLGVMAKQAEAAALVW